VTKAHKNIGDVLAGARTTLQTAEHGYEDFTQGSSESRKTAGLWNVLNWGRSVSIVLQHIRTFEPVAFDEWYAPKEAEMRADSNFQYLKELRNQVTKEGAPVPTTGSMYIESATGADLMPQGPAPAGTVGTFVGDNLGGSGWVVRLPDGTEDKVYASLPLPQGVRATLWANFASPTVEKRLDPPTERVDHVLRDYLDYLGRLVAEASERFGHK
jgi:hypothetical protein